VAEAGKEAREEERERLRLLLDAYKHFSTLNVAALVLFLALIRDFSPRGSFDPDVPALTLLTLGASLVGSVFGYLVTTTAMRRLSPLRITRLSLVVLYICGVTFLAGMIVAIFVVGGAALSDRGGLLGSSHPA
jgi:threonine/homoserine/homoserine lactone efflux protein